MKNKLKKKKQHKFLVFQGVSKAESSDCSWIPPSNLKASIRRSQVFGSIVYHWPIFP